MKKYLVIIFDCDGVLFDSRQANVNYYNAILDRFGLSSMEEEQIDFIHTHTGNESVRYLFQNISFQNEAIEYKALVDYGPYIKDMIMEPGLKEFLVQLKPEYGLAIATNRSDTIHKVIEYHQLHEYFDIIISSLDVVNPKPHPECLFKILDFFKLKSNQAIYIGDSMVDKVTAQAAQITFIAFKNNRINSTYLANSLFEVMDLLNEIGC